MDIQTDLEEKKTFFLTLKFENTDLAKKKGDDKLEIATKQHKSNI